VARDAWGCGVMAMRSAQGWKVRVDVTGVERNGGIGTSGPVWGEGAHARREVARITNKRVDQPARRHVENIELAGAVYLGDGEVLDRRVEGCCEVLSHLRMAEMRRD
jgi:hypothetical protein